MKTKWTDRLSSALEKSLGNMPDEVPKGFRKSSDWAKLWKRGPSMTEKILREHVKTGRMEMQHFRIGEKSIRATRHFRAVR